MFWKCKVKLAQLVPYTEPWYRVHFQPHLQPRRAYSFTSQIFTRFPVSVVGAYLAFTWLSGVVDREILVDVANTFATLLFSFPQ